MESPEPVRDFSYDSLQKVEYQRSQRWSSFFSTLENLEKEEEIQISLLDDVISKSNVEDLDSSQCDEAEESDEEEMTLEQLDILLDITNHKHSNEIASPMSSLINNLEDTKDNNDLMDTINQTLPIVEEHVRKSKETGIDSILNTFDAKVIKEKVGCLIHPKIDREINANCQNSTQNKLQKYKQQKHFQKHQDDSSSDADSMHSMETARYVLSSRKKRLVASTFTEKTTIKSYCKLKSRRDLLHQKYAIEEEDEESNSFQPHNLRTSTVCAKAPIELNVNRLTQSERRPKLYRKRCLSNVPHDSDDENPSNYLKKLRKSKRDRICNCNKCKKSMKTKQSSEDSSEESENNLAAKKEKKPQCSTLTRKDLRSKIKPQNKQENKRNAKKLLKNTESEILIAKKLQKTQSEKLKQDNKISKKSVSKNKNKKITTEMEKHNDHSDLNLDTNSPQDDTFQRELQTAIKLSQKTYKDEIEKRNTPSTTAIELKIQMFQNAQPNDNDVNDDDSFESILPPQPKSKKMSKLRKMKYECSLIESEKTFFANANKICNSTAIGHNITAAKREFFVNDSKTPNAKQISAETPNVKQNPAETPNAKQIPVKTPNAKQIPVKTPNAKQIPAEMPNAKQIPVKTLNISTPLPLLEKQKNGENDCNVVTSTSNESQNLTEKHILLYTPKDKNSKLSPNSRNSGYFNITQEHLKPVIGEKKAKKFLKFYVGRRCFDINSTVYYCPPEDETISDSDNTNSEDDELENFGRYGDLHETK